jgi:hypothetical protein
MTVAMILFFMVGFHLCRRRDNNWQPARQLHGIPQVCRPLRVVLLIAEEQAVCSGRLERKRDTFLPLLEHAIAYLHKLRVRFNVGLQIL